MKTFYVIKTFKQGRKGMFIPDTERQADDKAQCESIAERLSRSCGNVLAFSREVDPDIGAVGEPVVIANYGNLPNDLIELVG